MPCGIFSAAVNTLVRLSGFLAELLRSDQTHFSSLFHFEGKNAEDYIYRCLARLEYQVTCYTASQSRLKQPKLTNNNCKKAKLAPSSNEVANPVATITNAAQLNLALADGYPAAPAHHLLFAYATAAQGRHPGNSQCPALKSQCNNCSKHGHFAHICQSSKVTVIQKPNSCSSFFRHSLDKGTYVRAAAHCSPTLLSIHVGTLTCVLCFLLGKLSVYPLL